jgi:hypothetical protein
MSASNLGYTPGSGASVATDLDGGVHHQKTVVEFLDNGVPTPVDAQGDGLPVRDQDAALLLQRLLMALSSPVGYDRSQQRQRVVASLEANQALSTVATVNTVTTCSTVSLLGNIAAIDGLQPRIQIYGANLSAWRDCVRSCIS